MVCAVDKRGLTARDAGMGALYFFASHMVIRAMFHVGVGRSPEEMAVFLLVVMGSVSLAHACAGPLLRARITMSAYMRLPAVSLLAAGGALLELGAVLPIGGLGLLCAGGAMIGLACGWLVVVWMSSFHVAEPDPATFAISPALLCAVAFYFLFRAASTVSVGLGDGVLSALPLVAIACLVGVPGVGEADEEAAEFRRSSLVLVCVSAAFAVLSSVVVYLADQESLRLDSSLNYMTLFEAVVVGTIAGCCWTLRWLSAQRPRPRRTGPFVALLLVIPGYALGLVMGFAYEPADVPGLMWEVSLWVMLVAVFAYDLRGTLYLAQGLAVGLMFEAMCMGQMAMQVVTHVGRATWVTIAVAALSVAYLVSVIGQLLGPSRVEMVFPEREPAAAIPTVSPSENEAVRGEDADAAARCAELGRKYGLTQSEVGIFAMTAHGRSARYIADELGVSFNTVRTHIRHVYEKLGIHSKQELIDLVNGG